MRSYWYSTYLRDSVSLSCGVNLDDPPSANPGNYGIYPPILQDALDYIRQNKIAMVIALDIRDVATAQAAWTIIQNNSDFLGRPYSASTVFKTCRKELSNPRVFQRQHNWLRSQLPTRELDPCLQHRGYIAINR